MANVLYRVLDNTLKSLVDMLDGTHAERVVAEPPLRFQTDGGGPSARMRVDPGDTDFFAGRKFAADLYGVVPVAGPAVTFRFTAPINFILWLQRLELTQGALELQWYVAPSSTGGTWTDVPLTEVNDMDDRPTPFYLPQCAFATGGTFTGGTPIGPPLKARTASGNSRTSNVGESRSERGRRPRTYYGRLQTLTVPGGGTPVNDAADYVYTFEYAERP